MLALWVPFFYAFVEQFTMLFYLVPITIIAVGADFARAKYPAFARIFNAAFNHIMRAEELIHGKRLGSTFFLPACCLCILIFPKVMAICAICVLVISDTAAALVGKMYGKRRIGTKSVEGTLAFVISAAIVVVIVGIFGGQGFRFYLAGFIGALAAATVELFAKQLKVDDNFSIPVTMGLFLVIFA